MKLQPLSINGIEFDALISESKVYNSDVPEYAVEDGYSVSDNISIRPTEIEITGIVNFFISFTFAIEGLLAKYVLSTSASVTTISKSDLFSRMIEVFPSISRKIS